MPSDGAGGRSGGDGDRGSGGSTSGGGRGGGGGSGSGKGTNKENNKGGFGGVADSVGGGFGMSSVSGNTAAGVGGAGFGGGRGNKSSSNKGDSSTPQGLRSIEDAHKGLAIAGPQLSRARDNAVATNLARGLTALGMVTGFPGFSIASALTKAARDYGRGYADRTDMEKAADALGMGATTTGGDDPKSGGLSGVAKQQAKAPAKAPARAAASGNAGSGSAGATVIMGADKTRTGAGAGGRAKGSAVRGFGTGGLKI